MSKPWEKKVILPSLQKHNCRNFKSIRNNIKFRICFLFRNLDYFPLNYKHKVLVLKFTQSNYELKRYMNNEQWYLLDLTDQPTFFWSNLNPFGAESWNWNWGVSFFKFFEMIFTRFYYKRFSFIFECHCFSFQTLACSTSLSFLTKIEMCVCSFFTSVSFTIHIVCLCV